MKLKKILALVLVFCMCLSMVPTYAFADDEGIYVEEDYEEPAIVEVPEEVVEEETPVEPVEEELPAAETEEEIPEEVADPVEEEPSEEPEEDLDLNLTLEDEDVFAASTQAVKILGIKENSPDTVAYVGYVNSTAYCVAFDNLEEAVAAAGTGEGMFELGTTVTLISSVYDDQYLALDADVLAGLAKDEFVTVTAEFGAKLVCNVILGDGIELANIAVAGSIYVPADAVATLTDVTVTGFSGKGLTVAGVLGAKGLEMTGTSNTAIDVYLDGEYAEFTTSDAILNDIMSIVVNAGTLNVSGGTYHNALLEDGAAGPVVGNITGGTYESVHDPLFAVRYGLANGTVVKTDANVAYIGESVNRERYATMTDAVRDGNSGEKTIVLLKNIADYTLPANTTMTLDETAGTWTQTYVGQLTKTTISEHVTKYATSAAVVELATGTDAASKEYYATIAEAFEAMAQKSGQITITLMDPAEDYVIASDDEIEVPSDKTVVLDLNGHNGKVKGLSPVTVETGIAVRGELTVKNGMLIGNENTVAFRDNAVFYVTGTLIASNTDIINTTDTAIKADGTASTITLKDGVKINAETAIASTGTVTLGNCKLEGKISVSGNASNLTVGADTVMLSAVEIGSGANFTVNGVATFTDVVTATKANAVNISNGSFEKAVTISGTDAVAISGGVFAKDVTVDAKQFVSVAQPKDDADEISGGTFLGKLEIKGAGDVKVATATSLSTTGTLAVTGSGNVEIGAVTFPTAFEPAGSGKVTVTGATFNETVTVKGEQAAEFVKCNFNKDVAFAGSGEITVSGGSFAEAVSVTGTSAVTVKGAAAFAKTVTVNSSASGFAVQKDGEDEPSFTGEVFINITDTDNIKVGAGKFYGQGRYVEELDKTWLPDNTYKSEYKKNESPAYITVVRTDVIATYTDANGKTVECYNNEELNKAILLGTKTTLRINDKAKDVEFVLEAGQSLKVISAVRYKVSANNERTKLSGADEAGKPMTIQTAGAQQDNTEIDVSTLIDFAEVNTNKTVTWTAVPYIATVGSERFLSLEEAVSAASNSQSVVHTVTLWHDAKLAQNLTVPANITIDGSGEDELHTIKAGTYWVKLSEGDILKDVIVDCASGLEIAADSTLQNVTVISNVKGITVDAGATLTAIGTLGVELPLKGDLAENTDTAIYLATKDAKIDLTQCTMIVVGAPQKTKMPTVITGEKVGAFTLRYNGEDDVKTVYVYGADYNHTGYEVKNSAKMSQYPYMVTIKGEDSYYSDFATATDLAIFDDNKDSDRLLTLNAAIPAGGQIKLENGKAIIINLNGQYKLADILNNNYVVPASEVNDLGTPVLVEGTDTYQFGVVDNVATVYWTEDAISGVRVVSKVFDNLDDAVEAALSEHVNQYPYIRLNRDLEADESIKISAGDRLAFEQNNHIKADAVNKQVYSDDGLVSTTNETRSGKDTLVFIVSNEDAVLKVGSRLYTVNLFGDAVKQALASNTDVQILKDPGETVTVTYSVPQDLAENFRLTLNTTEFVGEGGYTQASFKKAKEDALGRFVIEPKGTSTDVPYFVEETKQSDTTKRMFSLVKPVVAASNGSTTVYYRTDAAAVQDPFVTTLGTDTKLYVMPETTKVSFSLANGQGLTLANKYFKSNDEISNNVEVNVTLADASKTFFLKKGVDNGTAKTWEVGVLVATVTGKDGTEDKTVYAGSLKEAFDEAAKLSDATVTLNAKYDGELKATASDLPSNIKNNLTINLSDKDLAVSADITAESGKQLTVVNGKLNFAEGKGFEVSGKLVLGDKLTVKGSVAPVIVANTGSSVSIENATIAIASATSLIKAEGGEVEITGAKLSNSDGALIDANGAKVTINGGTFDAKDVIATITDLEKLVINSGSFNVNAVMFNGTSNSGNRTLGVFVPYGKSIVKETKDAETRYVVKEVASASFIATSSDLVADTDETKHALTFNGGVYKVNGQNELVFDFEIHAPAQVTADNIVNVATPTKLPENVSFVELASPTDTVPHYVYKYKLTLDQDVLANAIEVASPSDIVRTFEFNWNKKNEEAKSDIFTVTIPTENFTATNTDLGKPAFQSVEGLMTWKNGEEVIARIGKVGYTSLFAAMSAVQENGTINLIKNYEATGTDAKGLDGNTLDPTQDDAFTGFLGTKYTLDLGGYTFTPAAPILLASTTDVEYTVKNGTIDISKARSNNYAIQIGYPNTAKTSLTIDGITLIGTPTNLSPAILAVQDKATVTVKDTDIASVDVLNGGELSVENGEFESIKAKVSGTENNKGGTVTIKGSIVAELEANGSTVNMLSGTVKELKAIDSKVDMIDGTVATLTSLKTAGVSGTPTDIVIQGGEITDLFNGDVDDSTTVIGGKVTVKGGEIKKLYTNVNTVEVNGGDIETLYCGVAVDSEDITVINVERGHIASLLATGTDANRKGASVEIKGTAAIEKVQLGAKSDIKMISGSIDVFENIAGQAYIRGGNIAKIVHAGNVEARTSIDNTYVDDKRVASGTALSPVIGNIELNGGLMEIEGGIVEGNIDVASATSLLTIGRDDNDFFGTVYKSEFAPTFNGKINAEDSHDVLVHGGRFANAVNEEFTLEKIDHTKLHPTTDVNTLFNDDGMYHVYNEVTLTLMPNGTPESPVTLTVDGEAVMPENGTVAEFATDTDVVTYALAAGDAFGKTVEVAREGFDEPIWRDVATDTNIEQDLALYRVATDTMLKVDWKPKTMTVIFSYGSARVFAQEEYKVENVPVGSDLTSYYDAAQKRIYNLLATATEIIAPYKVKGGHAMAYWIVNETGEQMTVLHGEAGSTVTFVPAWDELYTVTFKVNTGEGIQNASITGKAGGDSIIPASYGSWLATATNTAPGVTYVREGLDNKLIDDIDLATDRYMYALDDLYDNGVDSFITDQQLKTLSEFWKITLKFKNADGTDLGTRFVASGHSLKGSYDQIEDAPSENIVKKFYKDNYQAIKDATSGNLYFAGWKAGTSTDLLSSEEVWAGTHTKDTTFEAVYTNSKTYNVTIKSLDKNGVATETTMPLAVGTTKAEVEKIATNTALAEVKTESTVYTRTGFDKDFEDVNGDVIYTAQYSEAVRSYKVRFFNGTDPIGDAKEVPYNTTPVYTGVNPTKAKDAKGTYTFAGWLQVEDGSVPGDDITTASPTDLKLAKVKGDVDYRAQFNKDEAKYTITFYKEDGTTEFIKLENVPYGSVIWTYGDFATNTTLPKDADAQYTYTFKEWADVDGGAALATDTTVTGNASYKATYDSTVNAYTITFYEEDGVTEFVHRDLPYGTNILATMTDEPVKAEDDIHTYTFKQWVATNSDAVLATDTTVTGNASYKATFTDVLKEFAVTFENWNGDQLLTYMATATNTPKFDLATPTKLQDEKYSYEFDGWTLNGTPTDLAKVQVREPLTFVATYTNLIRYYTVHFLNGDRSVLATATDVPYGEEPIFSSRTKPTKEPTTAIVYTWDGTWKDFGPITTDTDFEPNFIEKKRTYTVTWAIGTKSEKEIYEYGAKPVYTGTSDYGKGWLPEITEDTIVTGDITYTAQLEAQKWTVKFDSNGGSEVKAIEVENGMLAPAPADPTNGNFTFDGWYLVKKDGTVEAETFEFDTERITEDITLRAKWIWKDNMTVNKALDINDLIGILLKVRKLLDDPENYSFEATFAGKTVLEGTLKDLIDSGDAMVTPDSNDPNTITIRAVDVESTQMREELNYTITHIPTGKTVVEDSYSVQQYCSNKIKANNNPQLVALCYSMLNYGSRAQLYFAENTGALAYSVNENGTENPKYREDYSGLSIPESYNIAADEGDCTGISKANKALDLGSAVNLRFYFKPEAGYTIDMYDFSAEVNGTPVSVTSGMNNDGRFLVVISGIAASDFDDVYKVTITNKEDQSSKTVTYSVMAYAFVKQSGSATLADVCKAMYQYHLDAKAYFG